MKKEYDEDLNIQRSQINDLTNKVAQLETENRTLSKYFFF